MKYTYEVFLSPRLVVGFEQLKGEEADKFLKEKGYHHIHVDDEGDIHALSFDNQCFECWKVYKRRVPVFKTIDE